MLRPMPTIYPARAPRWEHIVVKGGPFLRLIRLGAFVGWAAMASFAIAGFAAFAPTNAGTAEPIPAVSTVETNAASTVQPDLDPNASVGLLAGRVAAMNFATVADPTTSTLATAPDVSALIDAQAATNRTTTTIAATTAAPRTRITTQGTPTTTTPAASPREYSNVPGDAAGWLSLVEAYFAPADVSRALWVIHCESSGNPNAVHGSSGASGLFQHLPKFWADRSSKAGRAGESILDPDANVAVAAWLVYSGGGWRHWSPSAGCWG